LANSPTQPPRVSRLVIASRESQLAIWQAEHIRDRLRSLYPTMTVDILGMTTKGDQILSSPLSRIGGKGLFVKELEDAMAQGRADIAVHSMKDVPMELPPGFALAAIGEREDPRDAFVSKHYGRIGEMPAGSVIGTSSLRRQSQLRARFSGLRVEVLRGNVNTRLRKLDEGRYDAIILAAAGLIRLGLGERITRLFEPAESLPAVGQGALGIECRADRPDLIGLLTPFNHPETAACVRAERAVSRALGGSCQVPLGAFATLEDNRLSLSGFVAMPDGSRLIEAKAQGPVSEPEQVGDRLAQELTDKGAREILDSLATA
jgi:hydroxymethylbilane synthase